MKFNKKFLGIFLSLSVVFGSSVLVSARDIVEVSENEGVETITTKQNINNTKEIKEAKVNKNKKRFKKVKFEEIKKEFSKLADRNYKEEKLVLEKLKGFLEKLKKNPKESVYKDIIDFRIKEYENKLKRVGKEEEESLKEEIDRLKKLKGKSELSDLDKGNIKANLEVSIEMAKSNLNDIKKHKKVKFKDAKQSLAKSEQNKSYMVGFLYENTGMEKTKDGDLKNLGEYLKENKTNTSHRLVAYVTFKKILEENDIWNKLSEEEKKEILSGFCSFNLVKPEKVTGWTSIMKIDFVKVKDIDKALSKADASKINITREDFKKAKEEFLEYFGRHVQLIEPSYNEYKKSYDEKNDRKIINLMIKENRKMLGDVEKKLREENLDDRELEIAENDKEYLQGEIEKLKGMNSLDKKEKKSLERNLKGQKRDLEGFKQLHKSTSNLRYESIEGLNKKLKFDKNLKNFSKPKLKN